MWAKSLGFGSVWVLASANAHVYRFAVVAKDLEKVFFQEVGRGCQSRARELTSLSFLKNDSLSSTSDHVTCVFVGSPTGDRRYRQGNQTKIVEDLLENDKLDGMAIAVIDPEEGRRLIQKALGRGIPTITYNVDAPDSGRMAYVGADNEAFGEKLANTLLQSKPNGGKYVIVDRDCTNIKQIAGGLRERLENEGSWSEVTEAGSPLNCEGQGDIAHRLIYEAIERVAIIDAIVSAGSYPVREQYAEDWKELVKDPRFSDVHFVAATERDSAIALFKEGYINSLVGLQPFAFGVESIDRLHELSLAQHGRSPKGATIFPNGTLFKAPLISLLSVDAYLQDTVMDMNYLGNLVIFGYIAFGVIAFLSVIFCGVTTKYKGVRVIRASQPFFLQMIIAGALICSAAIIRLGFDSENYSLDVCSTACKVSPWLFVVGFNIVQSALYAKTRRINQVMKSAKHFKRVAVTEKDVLKPFAAKMLAATVVLVLSTVMDPAIYTISASSGTDNWNRSYKSFYGTCYQDRQRRLYYLIPLFIILSGSVVVSIVEAYKARRIQTEYQESKYIACIMLCILQAFVLATPLLALLQENPQAQYVVLVLSIFIVQLATLLFIFVPKLIRLQATLSGGESLETKTPDTSGLKFYSYRLREEGNGVATKIAPPENNFSNPTGHTQEEEVCLRENLGSNELPATHTSHAQEEEPCASAEPCRRATTVSQTTVTSLSL